MQSVPHNTYHRPDGVIGVGLEIQHANRRQHSVVWPDKPGERFLAHELEHHRIRVEQGEPSGAATSTEEQPATA